jgi:SAM-dependent methyltransferase
MEGRPADAWAHGVAYEAYMGRWSRAVARAFVDWLGERPDAAWLDVGCGTGALAETIVAAPGAASLHAVDSSHEYAAHTHARLSDGRVTFAVADARALPFASSCVDVAVSGLVLNFVPDPALAVAEMRRVARVGGTVAAYVWDYAAGMRMLRVFWDSAIALDPGAAPLDEGRRFPLCHPAALAEVWERVGLQDVEGCVLEIAMRFRNFDDYWLPFLGGQGPAPGYVRQLAPAQRERLRQQLHTTLPIAADGTITLAARAWAVRGTQA